MPKPQDDEVLVRVQAVSINDWDWQAIHGIPIVNRAIFGVFRPRSIVLGSDISGLVESVDRNVRGLKVGDEVVGDLSGRWGGFAEFVCAPQDSLARKPPSITHEQAAAIPQAGLLALQGFEKIKKRLEHHGELLINGAGGGVGTFALQLARLSGARVTAVDSEEKHEMLRSLGASRLINHLAKDFTRHHARYDAVLDVKTNRPLRRYVSALRPGGIYVTVGGDLLRILEVFLLGRPCALITGKRLQILALKLNCGLSEILGLVEAGRVVPVLDATWNFRELPAAIQHFGSARHKGKVVVTVAGPSHS